jgi:hypothetical protein
MKVIEISRHGISTAPVLTVEGQRGKYLCISHGERGRGRWEYLIPLSAKDFPPVCKGGKPYLEGEEITLRPLGRQDAAGNPLFVGLRGEPDGKFLVLWSLSPGFRGEADYNVLGNAEIIARGRQAEGLAGRAGHADCLVVLVTGPCQLTWYRRGRLYGSPADWVAIYDGDTWTVSSVDGCVIEDAALA